MGWVLSRIPSPEGLKPEPDENILNLLKIMSHDLRSSLLSMLATLKLLNRGYYGKMDEEVAHQIKELLSSATRLTRIAEAWLEGTLAGPEEAEIVMPDRVIEHCERNTPNQPVSIERKGNALIP
jgi:signal transduction histidine kinase